MRTVINAQLKTHRGDPYNPLELQALFHASPAQVRAFIGAQNSGKTVACAAELLREAIQYPGAICAVGRWALGNLRTSAWVTLRGMIMQTYPGLVKKETNSASSLSFELVNGSIIRGVHLQSADALGSTEWSSAWIEECHEIDERVFHEVIARTRPGPPGSYRVWLSGYPERGWLYDRFVEQSHLHPDQALFQPRSIDNPFIEPGWIERLRRSYSEEQARVLLEGSWEEVAGTIFEAFSPSLHVVPTPRAVPKEWLKYRSLDPGYDHPAGCLWAAVDGEGNLIITDELREQGLVAEQFAAKVIGKSGTDSFRYSIVDPAADRNDHRSKVSVKATYEAAGIKPLRNAENDVDQSIQRIRSLLVPDPKRPFPAWHPRAGQLGSPRLFIFDRCRLLIQELLQYRWEKHGVAAIAAGRAKPHKLGDDLVDCLRYLSLEQLGRATAVAGPGLPALWQEILRGQQTEPGRLRERIGFRK